MYFVKKDLLKTFRIPISQKYFGKNKTWRGFLVVTLFNGLFLGLTANFVHYQLPINSFLLGSILGLSYLLFELPNSFLKRKVGIAPGSKSERHKILFVLLDRFDSSLGVSLVYALTMNLPFTLFFSLFLMAFIIHFCFSYFLFKMGLKESL